MKKQVTITLLTLGLLAPLAAAQSNVSATKKWTWGENIGWINWRNANNGTQGIVIDGTYMKGYAWSENVGWINFGSGTPIGGQHYANNNASDFGVNIDPTTGHLFGMAWGENIGWINFDTAPSLINSNQHARLDLQARRLRGYAWCENVGWINLDHNQHYVALRCPADFNDDGVLDVFDVLGFLNAFSAQHSSADLINDGIYDFFDVQRYLSLYSQGCP